MKRIVQIIGIYYGKSKAGKAYRVLYLTDVADEDTDVFEGRKCYTAFAPADLSCAVGQTIDIVCHKGETIVIV